MLIFTTNKFSESFILKPNRPVNELIFEDIIKLEKGENEVVVFVLDENGLETKHFIVSNSK